MRTVLRYKRKGHKVHPQYWLQVQGHYKNLRGKYIEHLGYWIPKSLRQKKLDRSLVMNKNRIRYWIGEGAVLTFKVRKHLSFYGLTNAPWIRWGRKTIYGNESKYYGTRQKTLQEFLEFNEHSEDQQRIREEQLENLILRRVKIRERLLQEFENKSQEDVLDYILKETDDNGDDQDPIVRSTKYWLLKEEYDRIENSLALEHPMKKELLFKKLNSIAERGFMDKDQISFDNPLFSVFNRAEHITIEPHADKLKRDIQEDMECTIHIYIKLFMLIYLTFQNCL